MEHSFGTSEYLFQIRKHQRAIFDYESRFGRIVLASSDHSRETTEQNELSDGKPSYFDATKPETCSPLYLEAMAKVTVLYIYEYEIKFYFGFRN